jgi:signal transduction histidine kinase
LQWLIGKDIELVTKLSPQIGWVSIDPYQIENVIISLAGRAREEMGSKGTFTIKTSNVKVSTAISHMNGVIPPGKYVMMSLHDTGPGLNKEALSQIFEPYFKTGDEGKESGLRLSTVYGIIRQSGGHILVQSEVGHGTSFEIYLNETGERN